jgi:hypothetical protein
MPLAPAAVPPLTPSTIPLTYRDASPIVIPHKSIFLTGVNLEGEESCVIGTVIRDPRHMEP